MNEIRSRLIRCFAAVFPQVPEEHIPTARQDSTEGWDSIATVTLFALIEQEFGIELGFEELENLESFTRIHDCLSRRAAS